MVTTIPSVNAFRSVESEVTFIARHSNKNVAAKDLAWNKIDTVSVICRSAKGCLLSVAATCGTNFAGEEMAISSWVDGVRAHPPPIFSKASRQSAILSMGSHTITTKVYVLNGDDLGPWEVDYTLYEGVRNEP